MPIRLSRDFPGFGFRADIEAPKTPTSDSRSLQLLILNNRPSLLTALPPVRTITKENVNIKSRKLTSFGC